MTDFYSITLNARAILALLTNRSSKCGAHALTTTTLSANVKTLLGTLRVT